MSVEKIKIDKATLEAIEKTLSKGDRVELIPVKDGVKAMKIERKEIVAKQYKEKNVENVTIQNSLDMAKSTCNALRQPYSDPIIEINGIINKNDIIY